MCGAFSRSLSFARFEPNSSVYIEMIFRLPFLSRIVVSH